MRHRRSVPKPLLAEAYTYYFKCYCSRCKLRYETFSKNFFLFSPGNYDPFCMRRRNSHQDLLNPLGEIAVAQTGNNGGRKSRSRNKVTPSVQLRICGWFWKVRAEKYVLSQSCEPHWMRYFIFVLSHSQQ